MDDENEIFRNYRQRKLEERLEQLGKNETLIQNFLSFCNGKQIPLTKDNIDYVQTIGIIAKFPNIVNLLNGKVFPDKEGLIATEILDREFKKEPFAPGYYYSDKFMVMAHPYFRRGHYEINNFAPRFIQLFWDYYRTNNQNYIAIDNDRVRINVDNLMYREFDTWYGSKFKHNIVDIENGIVKLRPPLGLEPFDIEFFFGDAYSLDIKWATKGSIKVFQAEEFKTEDNRIIKSSREYFPVKYLHAEFDTSIGCFRHFDGAIHFYNEDEYYQRRDSDFNYNNKNALQVKTLSQKLFKVNGQIEVADWVNLTSHYLTGNPLILEYFEGKLPDNIIDTVEKLITYRQKNKPTTT